MSKSKKNTFFKVSGLLNYVKIKYINIEENIHDPYKINHDIYNKW